MLLNLEITLSNQKQNYYESTINHISQILYPHKRLIILLFILFQLLYHLNAPVDIKGLTPNDKLALANLENYQMEKEHIIFKHLKDTLTLNYSDGYMFLVQNKTAFIASYQWANLVIIKNKIRYLPDEFNVLKEEIESYRSSNFFGITKHYAENISNKKHQQFQSAWKNLKGAKVIKAWSSFNSGFQLFVLENQTLIDPSMEKQAKTKSKPQDSIEEVYQQYYALIVKQRQLKSVNSKYSYSYNNYSSYRPGKSSLSGITKVLQWKEEILAAANKYQIDPAIVAALIEQESGGNPDALSPAGAIGLMQLMPGTARGLGVNPFDPSENIEGGTKYFSLQVKRFGNITDAMIAYNAGPGRVGQLLPEETQKYIINVPALIDKYRPYFT